MKAITLEKHVLGIVCSVFDAYSAVLFLPDEQGESHYLAAHFSLGNNIPQDVYILPGKGLVGWILHNHKPLLIPNFDHREGTLGYYEPDAEEGIKAFMGFPLPTGGALCVDSKRQYSFSEKDHKILQMFAGLVSSLQSMAHENLSGEIPRYFAELGVIQDLRFRYRRWPTFLKNFLRTMAETTEFDYCAFATLREGGQFYTLESESAPLLLANGQELRIPQGSGIVGWVFRNEQPVFAEEGLSPASALFGKVPDMPEFPSAICLPVMVDKTCRGVLCLANTEPRQIDESLRSFVRQAVDHLSLFLENLYFKSRLHSYMPKATLEHDGGRVYNPDSAPPLRSKEDDGGE